MSSVPQIVFPSRFKYLGKCKELKKEIELFQSKDATRSNWHCFHVAAQFNPFLICFCLPVSVTPLSEEAGARAETLGVLLFDQGHPLPVQALAWQ